MSPPQKEPRSPGIKRPISSMPQENGTSPPMLPAAPCITIDDLYVEVQSIKFGQNELLAAIKGNKLGTKGIIPRLDDLEAKHEGHEKKIIKWGGVAVGMSITLTVLKDWIFPKP